MYVDPKESDLVRERKRSVALLEANKRKAQAMLAVQRIANARKHSCTMTGDVVGCRRCQA